MDSAAAIFLRDVVPVDTTLAAHCVYLGRHLQSCFTTLEQDKCADKVQDKEELLVVLAKSAILFMI